MQILKEGDLITYERLRKQYANTQLLLRKLSEEESEYEDSTIVLKKSSAAIIKIDEVRAGVFGNIPSMIYGTICIPEADRSHPK